MPGKPSSVALSAARTEPHIRITKAARDAIRAHPDRRQRLPLLGLYFALASEENDTRHTRGEPFTVSMKTLAVAAGVSARAAVKYVPVLATLGLVDISSGRSDRVPNTYRLLSINGPLKAYLANRPSSLTEIADFVRDSGLAIPAETLRIFWEHNEEHEWQIPDPTGKTFRPCRDWQRLLLGFVKKHRPKPTEPDEAPSTHGEESFNDAQLPTPRTRKRSKPVATPSAPLTPRMVRVCGLLGREPDRPWSREERDAFSSAGLDSCPVDRFAADCAELAEHYEAMICGVRKDYRRRSLLALLLHWHEDVEKARAAAARPAYAKANRSSESGQPLINGVPFDPTKPHAHTGGVPCVN